MNPFSLSSLKCQCILTGSLPIISQCLKKLVEKQNPPLTDAQRIHQLEIAFVHLKQSIKDHERFQFDYAREMAEQQKRRAVDPVDDKLQTTSVKTGRKLTLEREAEEERRRLAIEAGRIKKRAATTRHKSDNKRRAL